MNKSQSFSRSVSAGSPFIHNCILNLCTDIDIKSSGGVSVIIYIRKGVQNVSENEIEVTHAYSFFDRKDCAENLPPLLKQFDTGPIAHPAVELLVNDCLNYVRKA